MLLQHPPATRFGLPKVEIITSLESFARDVHFLGSPTGLQTASGDRFVKLWTTSITYRIPLLMLNVWTLQKCSKYLRRPIGR
ncbi:hypothetical protein JTE90_020748 [Oedothorax gibbosus]|uniref:Uncharacterized protein n=1 Tax=Oedothorax gibbosus TaxID=931172 RepID=A0AAV6TJJ6_9ARAC|nr:hypothetical protein JTE90_020748 [Oedothorax gibbosus]